MRSTPLRRGVLLLALTVCACPLLAGCFTTTLNLGTLADAPKADPAYCGDWHFSWKEGDQAKSADLIIRNFDGKQYYAEWKQEGEKPSRMSGFLVPIKDATFAQLTNLGDKGELPDEHLILRVSVAGDKLTLRHLKEEFFKDTKTDEALRKKVEENVANDAMYAETATGSLVSQP
jgi:hypothetical protein